MKVCNKSLICGLCGLMLFTLSCEKEESKEQISLTFKGFLTDQTTGAPIANEKVMAVYGKTCCGGIEEVKGLDSVTTATDGSYTLQIRYDKDTVLYRHFVYPKGFSMRFRPLPPVATNAYSNWLVVDFNGPYSVPEDITDTLFDGRVVTTDFKMVPGALMKVNFNVDQVPQDRYLEIKSSAEGLLNAFNDDAIANFGLPVETNLKDGRLVPLAGGRKNYVRFMLKTSFDGTLLSDTTLEVVPLQGETVNRNFTF